MHKIRLLLVLSTSWLFFVSGRAEQYPKREFRGVWVQTVNQTIYKNMTPAQMRGYFLYMLDCFQRANFNAVIFQIRPQADAFYPSSLEPWSRFLTGTQGKAPDPYWDPLDFLIKECHKRGMEFHTWLNPYRVTVSANEQLASSHIYYTHPEWFVKYDGKIYFDPGIPACRRFICDVVRDIVTRYDVDAIHMDDYFYPYPVAGQSFPDGNSFRTYGARQGFYPNDLGDWRRNNVNVLIREIKETIIDTDKIWVRFGISPFGIYRNKKSTPDGSGSDTGGLQNYDDLYADVLLWSRSGWIDYLMPQIYWEIGYKTADYQTLINWWSRYVQNGQLYIGQDIERSIKAKDLSDSRKNQLTKKMELERNLPNVDGNCFWYGSNIIDNYGGITDSLTNHYHKYPALIPPTSHVNKKKLPDKPQRIGVETTPAGIKLYWESKNKKEYLDNPAYYCIYEFGKKEKVDLNDASKIVIVTCSTGVIFPYDYEKGKRKFVVTSIDRLHNESKKGKSKNIKF
ncbi:MAG: family 10 glycosylhydrolase [Candidatus Azobacteroides sp.]|nr:family 10 glycosylhydrolase [Candidatus Azobacteroides sp.]